MRCQLFWMLCKFCSISNKRKVNHCKITQKGSRLQEMSCVPTLEEFILTKYVTKMKEYDEKDPDKLKTCSERAFSQLLAFMYLENSDKAKYGSLVTGLQTQQLLKTINILKPSLRQTMF
jgi:hypothetical protein